jgi:hypothetical protein
MCPLRKVAVAFAAAVLVLAVGCGGSDEAGETASGATAARVTIQGRATDGTGTPVTGALVVPASLDRPSPAIPELAVLTDRDGRYTWRLPPGRYVLTVTAEGFAPASGTASADAGETVELDFTLTR